MRVHLSPAAQLDLGDIKRYIAHDRPLAAARFLRSIRNRIHETIAKFPDCGEACERLSPGLRRFPIGNYVIFYRVTHQIEIVRLLHGARDIDKLLGS